MMPAMLAKWAPWSISVFFASSSILVPSSSPLSGAANSCRISIIPTWGLVSTFSLGLLDDAGQTYSRRSLGSGLLQNSQCVIDTATSSAAGGGTFQQIFLKVTFRAGYAGAIKLYGKADSRRGIATGWQQKGAWTVGGLVYARLAAPPLPAVGASAIFEAEYTAADDANQDINDLDSVIFWMTKESLSVTAANSCQMRGRAGA